MAARIKVKSIRAGNDTAPPPCSATSRSPDARVVKTTAYESAPFSLMPLKLIPVYNPKYKYTLFAFKVILGIHLIRLYTLHSLSLDCVPSVRFSPTSKWHTEARKILKGKESLFYVGSWK